MIKLIFEKYHFNLLDIFTISIIVIIGIIHISFPFAGDQALFTIAAKKMAAGGILYKDFWDIKQPGIFTFYYIAGKLFGFNEIGIHLFELIYWILFSILLILITRRWQLFENKFSSSLLPLFIVGVYYCNATPWHLTQIESLINFPLFILIWLLMESQDLSKSKFLIFISSGFICWLVLYFKLIFSPIVLVLYLATIIKFLKDKESLRKILVRMILPVFLGFLIPTVILILYFYHINALSIVYNTFFILPPKIVAYIHEIPYKTLLQSINWFVACNSTFFVLSFIGFISIPKSRLISVYLLLWLSVGLLVILMQKTSWWPYHFQLLYAPLGILTVKGIDFIWKGIKKNINFTCACQKIFILTLFILIVFINQIEPLFHKSNVYIKHNFALTKNDIISYQYNIDHSLKQIEEDTRFLNDSNSLPGKIFVCGNPYYYLFAKRDQAIPINGWALELLIPEQWIEFVDQLKKFRPSYIFIDNEYKIVIEKTYPQFFILLNEKYDFLKKSSDGMWYKFNSSNYK